MDLDDFLAYGKAYSEKEPEVPTSLLVPAGLVALIYQLLTEKGNTNA